MPICPSEPDELCLFTLSWESSWRPPEASSRTPGSSGGHLERLELTARRLGAPLDRLKSLLETSWPVLGPSCGTRGPSWGLQGRSGPSLAGAPEIKADPLS
eukprot:3744493-Pyramimonas_sp.AAC.1